MFEELEKIFEESKSHSLGYPINQNFDYSELGYLMKYSINNVTDYRKESQYRMNTHSYERQVIDEMKDIMEMGPHWTGEFVNGGTEGNLFGLFLGREKFNCPHQAIRVIYSEASHYSVDKAIRILGLESIKIPQQNSGEINYKELEKTLKLISKELPLIFSLNIGTTMTGAIDDAWRIYDMIQDEKIDNFYIHLDAAFFGGFLPLLNAGYEKSIFSSDRFDSISISGHKFFGSPIPFAILLFKESLGSDAFQHIEYIGSQDTTLAGSRNAFPALFMKKRLSEGRNKLTNEIISCLSVANYAIKKLWGIGIEAWRLYSSPIVVIDSPIPAKVKKKWQIATEGNRSHIICLQHVSFQTIDQFIKDWKEERGN